MANYNAVIRTNYFSVADEARFREIMASCVGTEEAVMIFEPENGSKKFGFGCYGTIYGIPPDSEDGDDDEDADLGTFYDALQSVLADGDAIIITEIGWEKMRYLVGVCTVITKREIQCIDVCKKAVELAGELLGDNGFTTQMDY